MVEPNGLIFEITTFELLLHKENGPQACTYYLYDKWSPEQTYCKGYF